ncbi:MlaA family lipoprotein [Diaphorobacter caeni]|uniref:MlaA family lipoprotein n=1 Tax=Diaphorobacter caeni TaxID=2784387 RepID=UPI00188E95B6|nr:VacJ family lipoprotein [Diaphorobacter caeni]MBF5003667.1 VacJ family lipoprotein [Diaphorobacter caeni]
MTKQKTTYSKLILRGSSAALGLALLAGCASSSRVSQQAHPDDPYESFNRSIYSFNDGVDRAVLKPVATAYQEVTPKPVRTGVTNFFANLGDAWSFVNNLLQGRGSDALDSMVRFNVNTVFGLGGLLDIASEMRIQRHKQDFGLTLGSWGVKTGPYLVLPFLGPSTIRDTVALPVDWKGNLIGQIDDIPVRNSLTGIGLVDKRASLLNAGDVLDAAALDPYSFTRDVYLQVRSQRIVPRKGQVEDEDAGKLPEDY